MVERGGCSKNLLSSPCWPQSFLKFPKCFKMLVLQVEFLHHQIFKDASPNRLAFLLSGFCIAVWSLSPYLVPCCHGSG